MTTLNVQAMLDSVIDRLFLRFIPKTVRPNQITAIRFMMIPFVYYLLATRHHDLALVAFIIAASTDFIDGAMARTRNQITNLGKVIDPIADKLLMMTVLLTIGGKLLIVRIIIVFIIIELCSVILGAIFSFAIGKPMGANVFGKIKFVMQCSGVILLLFGLLLDHNQGLLTVATYLLSLAIVFAILAGIEGARRKICYLLSRNMR